MLLKRTELTAGSTWHAAGLLPLFNMSYTAGQLHKYSVDLYKRLPAETGQDVSFHVTGNLRLGTCRERMDEYLKHCGTANTIGVPFRVISPLEVKELWPLVELGCSADTPKLIGALYHPDDGHVAPAELTMALRRAARSAGAEMHEQTAVTGVERTASGKWLLHTTKGDITAEHVVCATGNYARETGRMFGLNLPAIPVEHQYIVYDESLELKAYRAAGGRELAVLRESDKSCYLREERMGWILGPYEAGAPARFADGVPDWFGKNLFPGDFDRLLPHVEAAQRRVPALEHCGIKDIVNGPISYTPDVTPLIGPAWGKRSLWLNEGHSFGITAAGGAGWQLAGWIVEGEPGIDMLAVGPRRFGPYTGKRYTVTKNEETYRNVFTIHFPDEERHDARPAKTSPVYDTLKRMGGVFGQRYGWERANWFAPQGVKAEEVWSFRRSNYFEHVGNECRRLREKVGVIDLSPFTKFEVTGARGCFVLAGPRSRDVMAKLTDTPLDNGSFPWLTGRVIEAGLATDVYALRVNFVGALGWELHFPIEYAHHLFDAIFAAGAEYGIGMAGMRAMESLRMEKSYRMWGSDLTRDYTPFEARLKRFVRMDKGPFMGREALEKQLAAGAPHDFVTLEVHGVTDADPLGNEPIFDTAGKLVGRATLGYYGHCLKKSLVIGYVSPAHSAVGTQLKIEVLGERRKATVLVDSPYDSANAELRA